MTPVSSKVERDGSVQSVDRAMRLLEVLAEDAEGQRLSDLVKRTGLSSSTVHRLLTTLEKRSFVQFNQSQGLWLVGRNAFSVGASFLRRQNFITSSVPFLRELRDKTRETANLGIMDDGEIITLAQIESREIARAISPVGGRTQANASAMGKALLATYPPDIVEQIVGQHRMLHLTKNTISTPEALHQDLRAVRDQGFAVDDEEFVPGVRCIAAAVFNHQGEAVFAISISGLASRVTQDRVPTVGRFLAETAANLTRSLKGNHLTDVIESGHLENSPYC